MPAFYGKGRWHDISKQLFKAHTAALLEPGDYKLVVKSRAGDAEGPLQTSFRKVKYLKVEDPAPVDPPEIYIVQCADEPEGKIHAHGGTATMNVRVLA